MVFESSPILSFKTSNRNNKNSNPYKLLDEINCAITSIMWFFIKCLGVKDKQSSRIENIFKGDNI